eukprot:1079707-Amphidinium_carterae.3
MFSATLLMFCEVPLHDHTAGDGARCELFAAGCADSSLLAGSNSFQLYLLDLGPREVLRGARTEGLLATSPRLYLQDFVSIAIVEHPHEQPASHKRQLVS